MLLLLLLGLGAAHRRGTLCDDRTATYQEHGDSNENDYYFDPRTHLLQGEYPQPVITSRGGYLALLTTRSIGCTGRWCVSGEWKCLKGNSQDCYNVEHIIPNASQIKEIEGCEKRIPGNMIMAYGRWNQQLSNVYYGEKVVIYGRGIVLSAYASVYQNCYGATPARLPAELCIGQDPPSPGGTSMPGSLLIILGGLACGLAAGLACAVWTHALKAAEPTEGH